MKNHFNNSFTERRQHDLDFAVKKLLTVTADEKAKVIAELAMVFTSDIGCTDKDGDTLLHFAARQRHKGLGLELVIAAGLPDIDARNNKGETPLMQAAQQGDEEEAELLLKHGADLHAFDANGENATMIALRNSNLDTATALLKAGGRVGFSDPVVEEQIGVAWKKINPAFCVALDARQKQQSAREAQSLKTAKAAMMKAAVTQGTSGIRVPKTARFATGKP